MYVSDLKKKKKFIIHYLVCYSSHTHTLPPSLDQFFDIVASQVEYFQHTEDARIPERVDQDGRDQVLGADVRQAQNNPQSCELCKVL